MMEREHSSPSAPDEIPAPLPGSARIDLHIHSLHSDGTLRPEEIVGASIRAGLHTISITDHDTVAGLVQGRSTSRAAGIGFLPGVELSIGHGKSEIHILGYGIDPHNRKLLDMLEMLAAEREERMGKMIRRLNSIGVPADYEEVRATAGGKILSRLHLAVYLHEKGAVSSRDEAFTRYIGNGRPAYVRRHLLTLKDGIDLITGSGGIPVLAHPALTRRDDLIEYLVRIGMRGIEVYYPKHSRGDTSRYEKICRRYDLIATGGSDFHGTRKPEASLGTALTPPTELSRIFRSTKPWT